MIEKLEMGNHKRPMHRKVGTETIVVPNVCPHPMDEETRQGEGNSPDNEHELFTPDYCVEGIKINWPRAKKLYKRIKELINDRR